MRFNFFIVPRGAGTCARSTKSALRVIRFTFDLRSLRNIASASGWYHDAAVEEEDKTTRQ